MSEAYNKNYLYNAMLSLAEAFDYAINGLGLEPNSFSEMLTVSAIGREFGYGDPKYVLGMSGIELTDRIIESSKRKTIKKVSRSKDTSNSNTPEYWAGWILAYWQWKSGRTFKDILSHVGLSDIIIMYQPYHEAGEDKFVEDMEERIRQETPDTNLSRIRQFSGLSQSKLAQASGVNIRNIQQYEQRKKDINKAEVRIVKMLAQTLGCSIEELMEI